MLKKTLSALVLVTAFSAAAEPILLPGGVVVNNPAVPDSTNGLGNINNSLEFVQWFEVSNPDDPTQSAIVGLDEINSVTYGDLFGTASTATFTADDLVLYGAGELDLGSSEGDLNCGSCELTLSFGGLGVNTANGGFDLDGSFINIYVSDVVDDFNLGTLFAIKDNGATANATQLSNLMDGTLWVTGTFDQLVYNPDINPFNNSYGGLAAGSLVAAIQIEPTAAGIGIANDNVVGDSLSSFADFFNFETFDAFAFSLSSTFINGGASNQINTISRQNSGDFSANMVSAPDSLAILGVGLLALARLRRSRK